MGLKHVIDQMKYSLERAELGTADRCIVRMDRLRSLGGPNDLNIVLYEVFALDLALERSEYPYCISCILKHQ